MPFTFSHPALIFPLRYLPARFYSMTGLVIGSMTPDFEYFLRMTMGSTYSHHFWGIFYFDIPMGIFLSFLFHNIVRNELINHLPVQLRERFYTLKSIHWNHTFKSTWFIVIISIFIGAASHILWDDFTHPLGYFVMQSAFLKHKIQILGSRWPVYSVFQNLSSLIGGIIVCIFVWILPKNKNAFTPGKDFYWLFVIIIVTMVMLLRFLSGLTLTKYGNVIVSLISAFFISIILFPLFFTKKLN
jgi:VIT1/CCC1 family predicted Fe2+/Mn2+ transporter